PFMVKGTPAFVPTSFGSARQAHLDPEEDHPPLVDREPDAPPLQDRTPDGGPTGAVDPRRVRCRARSVISEHLALSARDGSTARSARSTRILTDSNLMY